MYCSFFVSSTTADRRLFVFWIKTKFETFKQVRNKTLINCSIILEQLRYRHICVFIQAVCQSVDLSISKLIWNCLSECCKWFELWNFDKIPNKMLSVICDVGSKYIYRYIRFRGNVKYYCQINLKSGGRSKHG